MTTVPHSNSDTNSAAVAAGVAGASGAHADALNKLRQVYGLDAPNSTTEAVLILPEPAKLPALLADLHSHYPFLLDVCGVDYPEREGQRFDVVYHFADHANKQRLRLKLPIAEDTSVPSATSVYRSANWFEREAYDMFGIKFSDHPNLRRILCHEDFVGHPLRKDYPADKNQSLTTPLEHIYEQEQQNMRAATDDHLDDRVLINIGPAHPATHGTLRFMAVLSGETIAKMDIEIGYLHRCFEKMCETHNYNQVIPYTDRLNYCSAPMNNNAWCRTIETMLGITVPPRAQIMRVILDEFSRCIDHFVCLSTNAVDLGALTNFWLGFNAREQVYKLFERLCGARLTVSLARVGGMGFDLPDGWVKLAHETLKAIAKSHYELGSLLNKNRIFKQRMVGTAAISADDAINWGFTGPCLRATGVPIDLRIVEPYNMYDQFEFDIPVGERGDSYDRFAVRMAEVEQSMRIIKQALDNIPAGAISVDDPAIAMPHKQDTYGNIEGLMHQFMHVIHGVKPPAGECYSAAEAANGELGFYVVSDGSGMPYRVKCRPPCFAIFQAFPDMCKGQMIADAIAALGSINIIAGELDR
ncbi:MAG: NADH dehydrogenase (quinone) subunit D [Pseudomonadota bacterium]|nr:NADH dehydrogenase (quinone) subunit D [Pseudomonadota bacterium]